MDPTTTELFNNDILVDIITEQKQKEEAKDIWRESPYKDLVSLQANNSGNVGEKLIQKICKLTGISSSVDGSKTKKVGGGQGDGLVNEKTVEIKTAHQGCSGSSFQHELGEKPWRSRYMTFVDITPQCIYLTIFENFNEAEYKSGKKCKRMFPTKTVTWRKQMGAFKLDTTVAINEKNVKDGNAIKITEATPMSEIGDFINRLIK